MLKIYHEEVQGFPETQKYQALQRLPGVYKADQEQDKETNKNGTG